MIRNLVLVLLLSLWLLPAGESAAPPPPLRYEDYPWIAPRGYVAYRAPAKVEIDGTLEKAWDAAPWSDDFVDIEGDKKPKPRFRTRMKMLWDDDHLYIAAEMEEPHVWGMLKEHDSVIFHDNDFEVFLDPDGDSHLYAEMEMNALNTTWDLLLSKPYKDGGKAIDAWEIKGLKTAVRVDGTLNDPRDKDKGWTVEIAWPWRSIRELTNAAVPPKDGDQWRINFSRVEWKHEVADGKYRRVPKTAEDNWVWSPQGVIDMHRPERWGVVQFSSEPPGKAIYKPDPALRTKHDLHRAYYRQRTYRQHRGRWASLKELGLDLPGVRLETTSTRFEASAAEPKSKRRWRINEEARVTRD